MLDAREPKNGDFASYVENLARLPGQHDQPPPAPAVPGPRAAKGQPAGTTPAQGAAWGHHASGSHATPAQAVEEVFRKLQAVGSHKAPSPEAMADARHTLSTLLGRVALVAGIAGAVLLGATLLDDPPPFADPALGIFLLVAAAAVGRLSRKIA